MTDALWPEIFEFYCGRYGSISYYCRWTGKSLILEHTDGGNFGLPPREFTPDAASWRAFRSVLEEIGCRGWSPEYPAAHGCTGVTYWSVRIKWGNLSVHSKGEDAYPGGRGAGPSPVFEKLLSAYRELIRTP